MNLYSESNGTSATRGNAARVSSMSSPPLAAEHDQRALGRVADQGLPVEHGVGAQHHRQQVGVEVDAAGRRRG